MPTILFRHGAIYPERRSPNNPTCVGGLFTKTSSQLAANTGFNRHRRHVSGTTELKQSYVRRGFIYEDDFSIGCKEWLQTGLFRRRRHRSGTTESEQPYECRGYVYLGCLLNWLQGMGSKGSCFDVGAIEESIPGGWPESVSHCACPTDAGSFGLSRLSGLFG